MCEVMRHRGPDGEGIHVAAGIGLGMRRLAVIDLATGDQPVTNESGTVHVVFNGEIYNYRELRAELLAKGHHFRGHSDTEVIPHLYDEHGPAFLARLNGMFSIALWDSVQRRLLLARDRLGIKPLFYSQQRGNLYFGSEVKCLLAAGGSSREIDPEASEQLAPMLTLIGREVMYMTVTRVGSLEVGFSDGSIVSAGSHPRHEAFEVNGGGALEGMRYLARSGGGSPWGK